MVTMERLVGKVVNEGGVVYKVGYLLENTISFRAMEILINMFLIEAEELFDQVELLEGSA